MKSHKGEEEIRDPLSFDSLTIATEGITEYGIETPNKQKGSIHILLDRRGLRSQEKNRTALSFDQVAIEQQRLEKGDTTPAIYINL